MCTRDYTPLFSGVHATHCADTSLPDKGNKARLTFLPHIWIWMPADMEMDFVNLSAWFYLFCALTVRLCCLVIQLSVQCISYRSGVGAEVQVVGVWRVGVSGIPDRKAI